MNWFVSTQIYSNREAAQSSIPPFLHTLSVIIQSESKRRSNHQEMYSSAVLPSFPQFRVPTSFDITATINIHVSIVKCIQRQHLLCIYFLVHCYSVVQSPIKFFDWDPGVPGVQSKRSFVFRLVFCVFQRSHLHLKNATGDMTRNLLIVSCNGLKCHKDCHCVFI